MQSNGHCLLFVCILCWCYGSHIWKCFFFFTYTQFSLSLILKYFVNWYFSSFVSRNLIDIMQLMKSFLWQQLVIYETSASELDIIRDISRTFPSHVFFRQRHGPGQRSLYNVLKAYSVYDRDVGYVQVWLRYSNALINFAFTLTRYRLIIQILTCREWGF